MSAPASIDRPAYTPHGAAWELMHSHAPELVASGPAGTGKTVACLWKVHLCAEHVPGLRALIARKTRASLTQSALVTFERDVLPAGHPAMRGASRANRSAYRYPNGAEIALGGLDAVSRIMSAEYDLVYIPEATELAEDDWESLTSRLRNGRLPYQQLLADCNPDRPTHWLKVRCDQKRSRMLESRHQDNPRYWDAQAQRWTPAGIDYIAKLDALTGPRKLRLRHGRWVRAEGVVYDGWDTTIHLIDRFDVPASWPRIWAVDFGFTNPFCWQHWAIDGDGRLYLVQQIYHTRRLVADHARRIKELTKGQPPPVAIVCDSADAEGRATLTAELGIPTMGATKAGRAKTQGIQAVQQRLRRQGDGKPRLYVLRDSLDEVDEALAEAKKPTCTEQEFDAYIWADGGREEPVDQDNHGLDALRYLVFALDAPGEVDDGRPTVLRA